jgi:hypothetical protein
MNLGKRRICPECRQDVSHLDDMISHVPLLGPRNISSSNIDRAFDNDGKLLVFEEKHTDETLPLGQKRMYRSFAMKPGCTAGLARGTASRMDISVWKPGDTDPTYVGTGDHDYYQHLVSRWFDGKWPT